MFPMNRKRKKILRFIARLNIGGPAIHTILLTKHFNSSHYESILVKGLEDRYEGNMNYLAERKGIRPIVIDELGRAISWQDDLKAFWKIYNLIKAEKPDIVHTHTAKAGAVGRIAAKAAGVPMIVHTFHGHVFHSYFSPWKTKAFLMIEQMLSKFSDCIITVSHRQREEILQFGIGTPEKVIAVPLGLELRSALDADTYAGTLRREWNIPDRTRLVGIVARLVPIKGHGFFLGAAKRVLENMDNVKFMIIGDGEDRQKLERFCDEQGIREHVIFCGFKRLLGDVYGDLDLVALSSFNEGLPVTLIEAMVAGKPIVATDVGGVRDLVGRNLAAELVPPRDSEAMYRAMVRALTNLDTYRALAQKYRRQTFEAYNIDRLVRDLEAVYDHRVPRYQTLLPEAAPLSTQISA